MYEVRQKKKNVSRRIDSSLIERQRKSVAQFIKQNENNKDQDLLIFLSNLSGKKKIDFFDIYQGRNSKKNRTINMDGISYRLTKNDMVYLKDIDYNEYLKLITKGIENDDYWITWPTYATGDMTSLSVLLINSEPEHSHGVKIYKDGNYGSNIEDAMNAWKSFIGGDIIDDKYIITHKGLQGVKSNSKESKNKIGFAEATEYVANNWNREVRKKVRKVWGISDRYDNNIKKWLNAHQITPDKYKNKDVVILWIRKSGENGGAHYENDTSFKQLRNNIKKYPQKMFYLAGDDKLDAKGNSKAESLTKENNNVVNLTQIWKKDSVEMWGGKSRTGQFNMYDFLKRHSKTLLHIGAMSGNLEAMALMGHETEFKTIDDRNENPSLRRMLKYSENDKKRSKDKDKIGYNFSPLRRYEKSAAEYYMKLRCHTLYINKKLSDLFGLDYLYHRSKKYVQTIIKEYDTLSEGTYCELKDKYKDSLLSNLFILAAKKIRKKKANEMLFKVSEKKRKKITGKRNAK